MGRKITIDGYKKGNNDANYPFEFILDEIPQTTSGNIEGWKCKECGNIKNTSHNNIYNKRSRCLMCFPARNTKITLAGYLVINTDPIRKIEYILDHIPNDTHVYDEKGWKCLVSTCNYVWGATHHDIYRGRGCPKCAGHIRITIESYRELAESRGYEYILDDIPPKPTDTVVNGWRCKNEKCKHHIFTSSYGRFRDYLSKCQPCYGIKLRKTLEDYRKINESDRKIKYILDHIPQSTHHRLPNMWQCQKQKCLHIWSAPYGSVVTCEHGCPNCYFKNEAVCREIMEELFCMKFEKIRPYFLEKLELDGYNPGSGIGFEYNGKQHYKFTPFFHKNGVKDFDKQQERDKRKYKLCRENGVILIIIDHKLNTREKIREFIKSEKNRLEEESEIIYDLILKFFQEDIKVSEMMEDGLREYINNDIMAKIFNRELEDDCDDEKNEDDFEDDSKYREESKIIHNSILEFLEENDTKISRSVEDKLKEHIDKDTIVKLFEEGIDYDEDICDEEDEDEEKIKDGYDKFVEELYE